MNLAGLAFLLLASSVAGHDPSLHGFDLVLFEPTIAAPALEGVGLDGQERSLGDYRGDYVLLNFWATWCPPCLEEMPALDALQKRFRDRGLVILAVTSEDDAAIKVPPFVAQLGIGFPVLLDLEGRGAAAYGARNLPSSFLIDRDGQIVAAALGVRDWSSDAAVSVFDELMTPP